jgi:hypothetical protein
MDELEIMQLISSRLEAAGIAYMVTGSIAAAIFGPPRMTRDIDVVLELDAAQTDLIVSLFAADFLADPDSIRTAVRERGMFNLIHRDAVIKVDFIVRKDTSYRQTEFQRRQRTLVAGRPIWVVAVEDLLLSKLLRAQPSHSELQLRDVRAVIESGHPIDRHYIEQWAAELGIMDLWREVQTS